MADQMNKPPAFQFYPDQFLSGTMHMLDAEVGLYMRLLCVQWETGSVPDDDNELASYGKGGTPLARIRAKFKKGADGQLRNPRLERERAKQAEWREQQRQKGIASGIARRTTVEPRLNIGSTSVEPEGNPLPSSFNPLPSKKLLSFKGESSKSGEEARPDAHDETEQGLMNRITFLIGPSASANDGGNPVRSKE